MSSRDLLAEIELTMVPSLPKRPPADLYVPAGEGVGPRRGSCRRRVWCALRGEEAEVDFETKSMLGFRRLVGVKSCSLFEQPGQVACGRHCLDATFRRQWPYALPLANRHAGIQE